jgi:toxin ParE1/3/4
MSKPGTPFKVLITEGAEQDLESIFDWICEFDSVTRAHHVLDALVNVADGLSQFPDRGSHPKELLELGIKTYRQTHFKPYRLIYRVQDRQVIIFLVADGRRDFQSLLTQRLLRV